MTTPPLVRPTALVRQPSPLLADGIVSHIERQPVDVDLAMRQWQQYVATLAANGWDIVEVSPAPDCPDSVFIEDTMVVYSGMAVIAAPGAPARRSEVGAAAETVASLGYDLRHLDGTATLDGGDVLKVGTTIYIGLSDRTNAEGVRQFAAHLEPFGAMVIAVPLSNVLHLKSAITALPDGTIIGWRPALDDVTIFERFVAMPEESGAHVVLLGDDRLLISADCPRSADVLSDLGYSPVSVDIGEFIKLEGCVTCLSVRLRP